MGRPEGVIKTWVIRWVVRAVYPDEGYPGGPDVGYAGTQKVSQSVDLIPKSPLRRGYLIWRLILVVACTLSHSNCILSDLIDDFSE